MKDNSIARFSEAVAIAACDAPQLGFVVHAEMERTYLQISRGVAEIDTAIAAVSDRERVMIATGYSAPMLRMERGNHVRSSFIETLPEEIRPLLSGSQRWSWKRFYG